MNKVSKEVILKDALALKIDLEDDLIDYYLEEVNTFINSRPEIDLQGVLPLRYVNADVVNVFSTTQNDLLNVDDLMKNVSNREGNYIKVPKVL